jgi:hypothetical protein
MLGTLLAAATGAALAYFLDPETGRRRRNMTRDRVAATWRRGSDRITGIRSAATARTRAISEQAAHLEPGDTLAPNDAALVQKVASEIFGDPDIPKGQININAEHGVVVLRGQLDRPEQITAVEAMVRKVPGVQEVKNLLHLPGTAPPRS